MDIFLLKGSCKSIETTTGSDTKVNKPKRKLPSTPSGLNQDPSAALSPYASHLSITNSIDTRNCKTSESGRSSSLLVPKSPPNGQPANPIGRPKLVENVTEWLNKSFDQTNIISNNNDTVNDDSPTQYKSAHHLLNIDSSYGVTSPNQKQHRSYSVAVPIPAQVNGCEEPLVEINMNKHFYLQFQSSGQTARVNQRKDDDSGLLQVSSKNEHHSKGITVDITST